MNRIPRNQTIQALESMNFPTETSANTATRWDLVDSAFADGSYVPIRDFAPRRCKSSPHLGARVAVRSTVGMCIPPCFPSGIHTDIDSGVHSDVVSGVTIESLDTRFGKPEFSESTRFGSAQIQPGPPHSHMPMFSVHAPDAPLEYPQSSPQSSLPSTSQGNLSPGIIPVNPVVYTGSPPIFFINDNVISSGHPESFDSLAYTLDGYSDTSSNARDVDHTRQTRLACFITSLAVILAIATFVVASRASNS